jgi:hypothetical protein
VLGIAYNVLCGGTCLQDIERRRQNEVYLDELGAQRIPDPTTAGDFSEGSINSARRCARECTTETGTERPDALTLVNTCGGSADDDNRSANQPRG